MGCLFQIQLRSRSHTQNLAEPGIDGDYLLIRCNLPIALYVGEPFRKSTITLRTRTVPVPIKFSLTVICLKVPHVMESSI